MRRKRQPVTPREVLETLYRAHYRALLTSVIARVSDIEEAEDIVSKTFSLALDHVLEGQHLDVAWLRTCTYNLVGSEYQRRERASRPVLRLLAQDTVDGPEDTIASVDFIIRGLETLPELDREIVLLAGWQDMTTAEIGHMVGLSNGAVKMRLSRARKTLRAILGRDLDEVVA